MARFIMILICTQYIFRPCKTIVKNIFNKDLSLIKVTHYLMRNPTKIIEIILELCEYSEKPSRTINAIARYCSYDKRNRINYEQARNNYFLLS